MTFDDPANPDEIAAAAAARGRIVKRGRFLRRRRQATLAGIAVVAATAVVLAVALTGSGKPTPRVATSQSGLPKTAPLPDTIDTPATGQSATPTTTPPGTPACTAGQFTLSVTTDKTAYARGESVVITLKMANTGVTCAGSGISLSCIASASSSNSSGDVVWDSWAGADTSEQILPQCRPSPVMTIPGGWSTSEGINWNQDQCAGDPSLKTIDVPNPNCPETQVPAGTYSIIAMAGADKSSPATVTFSG